MHSLGSESPDSPFRRDCGDPWPSHGWVLSRWIGGPNLEPGQSVAATDRNQHIMVP